MGRIYDCFSGGSLPTAITSSSVNEISQLVKGDCLVQILDGFK